MTQHLSTPQLHRYRYGELEPSEIAELKAHVEQCALCASRLRVQESERQEFILQPLPAALKDLKPVTRTSRPWLMLFPAFALAAAVLVAVPLVKPWNLIGQPSELRERIKGGAASLEVFAEREGRSRPLAPGAMVEPGDKLQLRFDPGLYHYATFLGRDGLGNIEVYQTIEVSPGGLRAAPFALELDDTPGDQELFAIFSNEEPPHSLLYDALEGVGSIRNAVITSIRLRKDPAR